MSPAIRCGSRKEKSCLEANHVCIWDGAKCKKKEKNVAADKKTPKKMLELEADNEKKKELVPMFEELAEYVKQLTADNTITEKWRLRVQRVFQTPTESLKCTMDIRPYVKNKKTTYYMDLVIWGYTLRDYERTSAWALAGKYDLRIDTAFKTQDFLDKFIKKKFYPFPGGFAALETPTIRNPIDKVKRSIDLLSILLQGKDKPELTLFIDNRDYSAPNQDPRTRVKTVRGSMFEFVGLRP